MPVLVHACVETPPDDTVICRFMSFEKFRDLFANEELYFRRTDLFKEDDPWEGLPSDQYIRARLGLRRYDPTDELKLINQQGFLRQNSEGYFIMCWQIFECELHHMWERYGKGVCVFSRVGLLKAQLDNLLDPITIGLVRYDEFAADPFNTVQFLFTKRGHFENEESFAFSFSITIRWGIPTAISMKMACLAGNPVMRTPSMNGCTLANAAVST